MLFAVILLVSVFAAAYPVLTDDDDYDDDDALRSKIWMSLSWEPFQWDGKIYGDIEGSLTITPLGQNFSIEPLEIYWERWDITTKKGSIVIYQAGIWSFENFKFTSGGPIMSATGKWTYLTDSTMQVSGVTTEFLGPPYPIYGEGEVWIPLDESMHDLEDDDFEDD